MVETPDPLRRHKSMQTRQKVCCGRTFWRDLRAAVRPPMVDAGRPDCDMVDAAVLPVPVVYALRSLTAEDSTSEPLSPLSRPAPAPPLAAPGPSAACRGRDVKWHKHNRTSWHVTGIGQVCIGAAVAIGICDIGCAQCGLQGRDRLTTTCKTPIGHAIGAPDCGMHAGRQVGWQLVSDLRSQPLGLHLPGACKTLCYPLEVGI